MRGKSTKYLAISIVGNIAIVVSLFPAAAFAQTQLQNPAPGLQQQTAPTQSPGSSQNQTGTPQTNNGQAVLDQSNGQPLGVVSDPRQTTPEVVVQQSKDLRANVTPAQKSSNRLAQVSVGIFILTLVFIYFIVRNRTPDQSPESIKNEFFVPPVESPKKQKKTRAAKKRKKPHQR